MYRDSCDVRVVCPSSTTGGDRLSSSIVKGKEKVPWEVYVCLYVIIDFFFFFAIALMESGELVRDLMEALGVILDSLIELYEPKAPSHEASLRMF